MSDDTQNNPGIFTQLLTGKDNQTHDIARWLVMLSFVVGLGLQIYVVVEKGKDFDLQQFGTGLGLMFAGFGSAIKLKETSEPG